MRYLGLDLGTKSCGIAISDRTNQIATAREPIFFEKENYEELSKDVLKIIKDNNITDVIIGLPKNMDGTMGFASERSINFSEIIKNNDIKIHFEDERLTTIEALNVIHFNGKTNKNSKQKIDSISAQLILESYLKKVK
jgi:putative Holliday junction resolvase